jgi:hypothetical protein
MKKVEFINEEENENYLRITEDGFLKLIEKNGIINTIREYDIPEEFILKYYELIDKNIIIRALQLSEDFINSALTLEYFENSDILNLNMSTYSNLSEEFILEYDEYINWERMIVYLSSSDKIDDIGKFKKVIDKFNLWNLISANELPIDFIRENASKLDWRILSIVNCFTEEEKEEFSNFIPEKKIFNVEEYEFRIPTVKDIRDILKHRNYTKEELSKKIEEESKVEEERLRFEVKHKVENLTKEDLIRLREMLNN